MVQEQKTSRIKQILIGLVVALVSVLVTVLLLEIGVRLVMSPPYAFDENSTDVHTLNYLTCDPSLGWLGQPNFQGIIDSPVFRQELRTNSQGMHDTEHMVDKSANTFRILMLGDSFVQAFQVDESETAHQVLEDSLNARYLDKSHQFEVLSAGALGWSNGQQLVYYREFGRSYEPDLVLLMFFIGNDFKDNLPGNAATVKGFNCYAPYFAVCDGQFQADPLTYAPGISDLANNCSPARRSLINVLGWLYQRSRLYQMIDPVLVSNFPRQVFGQGLITPLLALYTPNHQYELEYTWQVTEDTIAQLQQEVEADGRQFAVVVINPEELFNLMLLRPAERENLVNQSPDLAEVDVTQPNRRLSAFFALHQTPYLDLMEPMLAKQRAEGIPLHLQGDRHWTVEGNRFVGEVIAQWLAENDFLP